jgi:hypothetical protein
MLRIEMQPKRYDSQTGDPNLGGESTHDLPVLSDHIQRWWGIPRAFHELMSDYVHLDLHVVAASLERPHHTVITTGMSDRPMSPPKEGGEYYCELLLALPPEWPIRKEDFKNKAWWWPFRALKQTARFPHIYKTCVWHGHTVGHGDSLEPFHESAPFCGVILSNPVLCPSEALTCPVRDGKEVHFFSMIPLFERELKFAWENGSESLIAKLDESGVTELIQANRRCVV